MVCSIHLLQPTVNYYYYVEKQLNIRQPLKNKDSQHLIIVNQMLEAIILMAIWAIWLERKALMCNIRRWDVNKLHLNCIKLFGNFRRHVIA